MKPIIINKDSNFVVVTYWWGRGNKNKNTQLPCPEDLSENEALVQNPITFNSMINIWKKHLRKAKCNYLAVEYPSFAKKGMYQKAINFKPQFILKALEACYPRAVLYIDGDMQISKYPHIFDIENIDFMSQGWNSDSRYHLAWEDDGCYFPYVFETSGGTMYFNNTIQAKILLRKWKESVQRQPLKAEDRLISQIFNQQKMLLNTSTIQLPIEYLWLNQLYDDFSAKYKAKNQIYITHPACLTGEERAFDDGAAKNRYPALYNKQVSDHVFCNIKNMPFYEYIFFPTKFYVRTMDQYLKIMHKDGWINRVKYDNKYGAYNKIYETNIAKMKTIKIHDYTGVVHVCFKNNMSLRNVHNVQRIADIIPTIIKYMRRGNNVIFVPEYATMRTITRVKKFSTLDKVEFVCRNKNITENVYKKDYTLNIDTSYPMFFNTNSTVLLHLISMSSNFSKISYHFNSSFIFPSRIRCKWI